MKRLALETLAVAALGTGLALGVNALSPAGIPVTRALPLKELDARYITAEEARAHFEAGGQVLFVDARRPGEYAKGHIETALNLPAEEFVTVYPSVAPRMPREVRIVVYCGGIDCALSRQLADRLGEIGYGRVQIFRGGWTEWKARGWPSE